MSGKKPLTGTLLFNMRGGGARLIGAKDELVAWIPEDATANALHRDEVEARVIRGDLARVTRVVSRGRENLVGTYQRQKGYEYVIPDEPRIACNILVRAGGPALERPPRSGDKVVVKLEPWTNANVMPAGRIVELLGAASAPGVDMLSVIRDHDLPGEFPAACVREAEAFPRIGSPTRKSHGARTAAGSSSSPSIPTTRRISTTRSPSRRIATAGGSRVHIADVAHYVRPGTALDREARRRGELHLSRRPLHPDAARCG